MEDALSKTSRKGGQGTAGANLTFQLSQLVCIYSRVHGTGTHTWISLLSDPYSTGIYFVHENLQNRTGCAVLYSALPLPPPVLVSSGGTDSSNGLDEHLLSRQTKPGTIEPQEDLSAESTVAPGVVKEVRALEVVIDKKQGSWGHKESWKGAEQ